jgi:hypothetical protein
VARGVERGVQDRRAGGVVNHDVRAGERRILAEHRDADGRERTRVERCSGGVGLDRPGVGGGHGVGSAGRVVAGSLTSRQCPRDAYKDRCDSRSHGTPVEQARGRGV